MNNRIYAALSARKEFGTAADGLLAARPRPTEGGVEENADRTCQVQPAGSYFTIFSTYIRRKESLWMHETNRLIPGE